MSPEDALSNSNTSHYGASKQAISQCGKTVYTVFGFGFSTVAYWPHRQGVRASARLRPRVKVWVLRRRFCRQPVAHRADTIYTAGAGG